MSNPYSSNPYSSYPSASSSSYYDTSSGAGSSSNAPAVLSSQAEALLNNYAVGSSYDSGYLTQQSIYTPESYAHSFRQGRGPSLARKTVIRKGGGETWEDPTLLEWDPSHFRLFVGDLANDVSDDLLRNAFGAQRYPSFVKAKVVRDKSTNKSRGFGFVSYTDPEDFMKAWKEMDGKYVGSRPVKIKKATTQVGAVNIGAKKARDLDSKKKQPTSGPKKTSRFNVNVNANKPYARR